MVLDGAQAEGPPILDGGRTGSLVAPSSPTMVLGGFGERPTQVVVAVTGAHGDTMALCPELQVPAGTSLSRLLGEMEGALKASLRAHLVQCMQACGHMPVSERGALWHTGR